MYSVECFDCGDEVQVIEQFGATTIDGIIVTVADLKLTHAEVLNTLMNNYGPEPVYVGCIGKNRMQLLGIMLAYMLKKFGDAFFMRETEDNYNFFIQLDLSLRELRPLEAEVVGKYLDFDALQELDACLEY